MLKFTKVELHNFLSYQDAELNLDNQGVTLIEGVNNSNDAYTSSGSGKSSLLSAITYALYGKTVSGLTSNAVINKEAGTDCYVKLYFTLDDNKYYIARYRKGKNGNANKVRLYLNDKEITEATNPKTNAAIQNLIGVEFNTYINTISYGSSDEPVFSQATDKGKKEILENLANTGVYVKAKDIANEDLKEFKHKLENEESSQTLSLSRIETLKEMAAQDKQRYDEEVSRQKANKATLERLKSDRDNYAKESEKRLRELNMSLQEVLKTEPQSNVADTLGKAHNDLDKTNQAISTVNAKISQSTALLKDLRKQYTDINNKTVCPLCGHKLDEEHKQNELNNIIAKGNDCKAELLKYQNGQKQLLPIKDKQEAVVNKLQAEVNNYNSLYKEYQNKVTSIKNEQQQIKYELQNYDAKIQAQEQSSAFDIVPAKCYNSDIKEEEDKLKKVKRNIEKLETKIDNYTILVNKVFSKEGITSVVLDLITPYLNEHANYYLNKLSGSILTIDMNTQKMNANKTLSDKFDLRVHNQAGADSYQNCSAGERKRIDIAIAFAIQDLQQDHANTATNIAIYDECFDGLDSVGCESVIEILKEKANTISSIFVITHNDTLKPLFDNSIQVIKNKQGISSIGE